MIIKIKDDFAADTQKIETIHGTGILDAILSNRGIISDEDREFFLRGDITQQHDPSLLKDADLAAKTIVKHINKGSHIVVYSDYDADGWGSAIVALKMLRSLGANADYYTNTRAIGYGANPIGVADMLSKYPDVGLVITTDNGIVAYDAIDALNAQGIPVIVTDHHEPEASGRLPDAIAVVNPKRLDDTYPFKGICGAAVIWKVLSIVYKMMGRPVEETYELLDIVGFSTIGDVVPLVDENRLIVKEALARINDSDCREEWNILRKANSSFNNKISYVDAKTVAFTFVPQVNACSRLIGNIDDACKLFLSTDMNEKIAAANFIKEVNDERKERTSDQTERAYTLCDGLDGCPVIVIESESFDDGIVGLIAGRIKEAFWAPTIVLTNDPEKPGVLRGSGRSIEGFPMKKILDEIQAENGILEGYGGHDMACGLSLKVENLEQFRSALCIKAVQSLEVEAYYKSVIVDVDIRDDESVAFVCDTLSEIGPYGASFPSPVVRLKNFIPKQIKITGANSQHVIFTGENISVKCWNGAEEYIQKGSPKVITAYGELRCSSFDGKYELIVDPSLIVSAAK